MTAQQILSFGRSVSKDTKYQLKKGIQGLLEFNVSL